MLYIIGIIVLLLDQVSKYYALKYLKGNEPIVLINNFLQLNYVENIGAAFGILKNKQPFFIVITIVVIAGIIFYMKKNEKLTNWMRTSMVLILSGAIGNLIDRIRFNYVVDFIDVKFGNFYDYPVFNIADSAIVIGTILFAFLVLTDKYEYQGKEW